MSSIQEEGETSVGEELLAAATARRAANLRYHQALLEAKSADWTNTAIGMTCGVSEAAIRLYLKRHHQRTQLHSV